MQLRDFGRLASGNSRISVSLRSRVVKLTKALKPEKSAQKRVQVSAQASDIRIFALTASAVSASSWRFRGRGARARTFERRERDVDACEALAVREGIQRPCGSEERKYRQRCQEVQVSDGGQTSVPRTRQPFADFISVRVVPIASR